MIGTLTTKWPKAESAPLTFSIPNSGSLQTASYFLIPPQVHKDFSAPPPLLPLSHQQDQGAVKLVAKWKIYSPTLLERDGSPKNVLGTLWVESMPYVCPFPDSPSYELDHEHSRQTRGLQRVPVPSQAALPTSHASHCHNGFPRDSHATGDRLEHKAHNKHSGDLEEWRIHHLQQ